MQYENRHLLSGLIIRIAFDFWKFLSNWGRYYLINFDAMAIANWNKLTLLKSSVWVHIILFK